MNENIKNTCDLIISNRDALKMKMIWEPDANTYAVMAGLVTASRGVTADADKYKECKKILHQNANIFSAMRGLAQAIVITKMMMAPDPEEYSKGVITVYKKLREIHKLTASPYMVMAAMTIYEHSGVAGADADIEKLESLYKDLKKQHPLLIWDEDRGYLSMIAVSGMDIPKLTARIEESYEACKKIAFSKDTVHSLAQILALSELDAGRKCEFVKKMIAGLKETKTPISKTYGLTAVGALSLLGIPEEQLITDVAEASSYLKGKNGFKWYHQGRKLRTTYAALAVFMTYAKENESLGSAISSNIAMEIAEEIVMLIIVLATTSTQTSNSSSSSSSSK